MATSETDPANVWMASAAQDEVGSHPEGFINHFLS
jgi:hypothetical protein